ncbi:hypothetical protein D3C72_2173100 [compost metagenome]
MPSTRAKSTGLRNKSSTSVPDSCLAPIMTATPTTTRSYRITAANQPATASPSARARLPASTAMAIAIARKHTPSAQAIAVSAR